MKLGLGEVLATEQFSSNLGCLSDRNVSKLPQMLSLCLCCLSPENDPQAPLLVPFFTGIWSHPSPWGERFATFRLSVCSRVQSRWGFYCVAKIRGTHSPPPAQLHPLTIILKPVTSAALQQDEVAAEDRK